MSEETITVDKNDLATVLLWVTASGAFRFQVVQEAAKRLREKLKADG